MAGYEFAGGAIIPLSNDGSAGDHQNGRPPPARQTAEHVQAQVTVAAPAVPQRAAQSQDKPKLQPKSTAGVLRQARARVRELKAELKRMRGLQKELNELERLLKAAKEKPQGKVTSIRRTG